MENESYKMTTVREGTHDKMKEFCRKHGLKMVDFLSLAVSREMARMGAYYDEMNDFRVNDEKIDDGFKLPERKRRYIRTHKDEILSVMDMEGGE